MGRMPLHGRAFRRRRIAGAGLGADGDIRQAAFQQGKADTVQRQFQVFMNIVGQRLERRYIENPCLIRQRRFQSLLHQLVDGREKCRQGFTRTGGSRDQRGFARANGGPGLALNVRGCIEIGIKLVNDGGMKRG